MFGRKKPPVTIEPQLGRNVSEVAKEMVAAVKAGAKSAHAVFNEVSLVAVRGTTVSDIEAQLHAGYAAASEAYRKSPEGIAAKAKEQSDRRNMQATADALMVEFKTLDMASDVAVLDWLDRFQDPSDNTTIRTDTKRVIEGLKAAGYVSNANCGPAFNESDRDNYARYLVGQALSCLESVGAIHQVFGTMHERWKAKFLTRAASPTKEA